MTFFQRLFGARTSPGPQAVHSQSSSSTPAPHQALTQNATRRELLRVALRETLHRNGIPAHWIDAESLTAMSRTGERGLHWRLLVKHWDPRILTHGVALQQALIKRVTAFDPMAWTWLLGISWQFALADESVCPPLPHPGSWTAEAKKAEPEAPAAAMDTEGAHADLEKLFAVRDADYRQHATGEPAAWPKTEPAKLSEDA